jgi:hypothetical protein
MPDVIATSGSATANSFVSEDDAEEYMDARLNASAYVDADADDQARALIEATRELNVLLYSGSRTDATQKLAWPRVYAINPDLPDPGYVATDTNTFDDDEIPQRVKDATCELALEFLKAGTTDIAGQDSSLLVISETVGPISTDYAEPYARAQGLARYPRVMALIGPLLDQSATGGLELVRC